MTMTHPGLPDYWVIIVWCFMICVSVWALFSQRFLHTCSQSKEKKSHNAHINLDKLPFIQAIVRYFALSAWPLLLIKLVVVVIFMLVISAGLYGTAIPERNLATVLTWNIWWSGLIVSIFFLGSAWCAVCPWDSLATWLVKPRIWIKKTRIKILDNSLALTPPAFLRSVLPALLMFIGLTWLELGVGVTTSPYATALLSLLMVVLATISLALYKNKAFCHYFCPVGRTIGFYSQLAPIALRPINPQLCASCTTMECYNGNANIEACPTQLMMGSLKQNTYCTSCGNCLQSCPKENVSWHLRTQSYEAVQGARPHWDEAWFMLGLLALTSFHGLTMMPFWAKWISQFGQLIGDSGQLLITFTVGLFLAMLIPITLYIIAISMTYFISRQFSFSENNTSQNNTSQNNRHEKNNIGLKELFISFVFVCIPLAFAYHIAHNLNHLIREGSGLWDLFINPWGIDTLPLTMMEKHQQHMDMLISQDVLFTVQGLLMLFGFWIAVKVLRYRAMHLGINIGWRLFPMYVFILTINGFHLWLMMQPMVMRM